MLFSDNADKYEELRNAYNSVIDEGDLRVPPKEEWRGMAGICEHVFCRYVGFFCGFVLGVGCVLVVWVGWAVPSGGWSVP